jgi:uncharacterized protein (DUF58 family)
MRLTTTGRWTVAAAIAVFVGGRVLGLDEFVVIGVAIACSLAATAAIVGLGSLRLDVSREVRPTRVPVGSRCRVELSIRNRARRATPALVLIDPVGDERESRLRLAPLYGGTTRSTAYRLPAHRRGILTVGPLQAVLSDPLGQWESRISTQSSAAIIVLPRIHPLAAIPPAPGDEPDPGWHHLRTLASANEEFASLREYEPGDDVRRVHWPSTARRGIPVVRHYEEPWQRRTTVVLDLRRGRYTSESFERAVSAAASVVQLCGDREELVRHITTAGHDTGFIGTTHETEAAIDLLSSVQQTDSGSLTATLQALNSRRGGGALVTCTGPLGDNERSVLVTMGQLFQLHLAVYTAGRHQVLEPVADRSNAELVMFTSDDTLSSSWDAAVVRLRTSTLLGTAQ